MMRARYARRQPRRDMLMPLMLRAMLDATPRIEKVTHVAGNGEMLDAYYFL